MFASSSAAGSRRNRRAVRAGARVAEERANLVGGFGREDVLELAGLLLDFGFAVHGEAVGEQALGQAVTANDTGGALAATSREFDDERAVAGGRGDGLQRIVARIHERLW